MFPAGFFLSSQCGGSLSCYCRLTAGSNWGGFTSEPPNHITNVCADRQANRKNLNLLISDPGIEKKRKGVF